MKEYQEKEYTYVLFGNEAVNLYNVSLKMLMSSPQVNYKIGAYNDVKRFMKETKNWNGFIEISKDDYLHLKKYALKSPVVDFSDIIKEPKGFSFFKFFKS